MAPVRRLNKKEINILTRPWITNGILKSIKDLDIIHRTFLKEKDDEKNKNLFKSYKIKRNMIKVLIRQSKRDYFANVFEGIRNIFNI